MAEESPKDEHGEITDSHFQQLGSNLLIACVVLVAVFIADRLKWIPTDWAADQLLRFYANTELVPDQSERFLFINIDTDTFALMGEPLITPRDALVELLKFATDPGADSEGRASVVILDVALSRPADQADVRTLVAPVDEGPRQRFLGACHAYDVPESQPRPTLSANDQALMDFISGYNGKTPIVLARGFSLGVHDPESAGHARPERSFLDGRATIAPLDWFSNPNCPSDYDDRRIFWAAPFFERDTDLLVRRWRLWSSWCRDGDAGILPSVQLLALALAQRKMEGDLPLNALRQRFQEFGNVTCGLPVGQPKARDVIPIGVREVALGNEEDGRRIIYTAPAVRPASSVPGSSRQSAPSPVADLVVTLPAHLILYPPTGHMRADRPMIDRSVLNGRIVIIGASHPQARDDYATPIGGMPGAMLIVNATQSLAEFGVLQTVPIWAQLVYSVLIVCAVVSLFYVLNSRLATWVTGLGVLAVTLWASSFALKQGFWLNTAIPATGLAWFSQLLAPMAALRSFRTEGFGALLNPRFHRKKKASVEHRQG